MPVHAEQKFMPYSPEQLYALVADIEKYPDFLPWCVGARVRTRTEAVGRSSFTLAFDIVLAADDSPVAEGRSVQVWLDADRRPAPIPPQWRAELEATLTPPTP